MQAVALLVARVCLAALLIWVGYERIDHYAEARVALEGLGLPGFLLPLIILLELGGGLLLILGWGLRLVAALVAVYTLGFALLSVDFGAFEVFLQDLGRVGGLLLLVVFGPGRFSVDWLRTPR